MIIRDRNGETREIEADFGPIVKAVRQKEYLLPDTAMAKKARFREWCRANLQPGWYVTERPGFMGGGSVLFINDEMDIDLVTIAWGPAQRETR